MSKDRTRTIAPGSERTRRKAAWSAGFALLVMAMVAPLAQFGVLENLVLADDAGATTRNVAASPDLFRMAGLVYLVVAALDVVVAWALHALFRHVHYRFSLGAAWLRTAYAGVLGVASWNLVTLPRVLERAPGLSTAQLQSEVMTYLGSFHLGYEQVGLAMFGVHLLGLAYLVSRATNFPRFLGVLVMLAGSGYLFDSLGQALVPAFSLTVAQYTFVGEALLIFWRFWRAAKGLPKVASAPDAGAGSQMKQTAPVRGA